MAGAALAPMLAEGAADFFSGLVGSGAVDYAAALADAVGLATIFHRSTSGRPHPWMAALPVARRTIGFARNMNRAHQKSARAQTSLPIRTGGGLAQRIARRRLALKGRRTYQKSYRYRRYSRRRPFRRRYSRFRRY